MTFLTASLLVGAFVAVVGLAHVLRDADRVHRPRRRDRRPPRRWSDGDQPLRVVADRAAREDYAQERVDDFRGDMAEAARQLKVWAAHVARSRQAEWYGFEATTGLIEVELGREAIAVARRRLQAGATLDQAVRHAVAVMEDLAVDVVQRVGLATDEWSPTEVTDAARSADRRRRISRLRAKADSTPFPEEAASFRAKADELADRFGINA